MEILKHYLPVEKGLIKISISLHVCKNNNNNNHKSLKLKLHFSQGYSSLNLEYTYKVK